MRFQVPLVVPLRYHFGTTSVPLRYRFGGTTSVPLRNHFSTTSAVPLWYHFTATSAVPLRYHFGGTTAVHFTACDTTAVPATNMALVGHARFNTSDRTKNCHNTRNRRTPATSKANLQWSAHQSSSVDDVRMGRMVKMREDARLPLNMQ